MPLTAVEFKFTAVPTYLPKKLVSSLIGELERSMIRHEEAPFHEGGSLTVEGSLLGLLPGELTGSPHLPGMLGSWSVVPGMTFLGHVVRVRLRPAPRISGDPIMQAIRKALEVRIGLTAGFLPSEPREVAVSEAAVPVLHEPELSPARFADLVASALDVQPCGVERHPWSPLALSPCSLDDDDL